MKFSVEIGGLDEIYQQLGQLQIAVQKKMMRAAVKKGAEVIRLQAAANAPVDTGDLRDHMTTKLDRDSGGGDVIILIGPGKDEFYGQMQEFGTIHHTAHPFLQPALDQKGTEAIEVAGREAWRQLQLALTVVP